MANKQTKVLEMKLLFRGKLCFKLCRAQFDSFSELIFDREQRSNRGLKIACCCSCGSVRRF